MVGEAMEARATGSTDIPSTVGGSHIANNINTDEPRHQSASMALSGITASMATATESSQPLHRLLANGAVPTFKGQAQSVIHLPGGGGGDGGAAVAEVSLATRTQYLPIVEAVEVPEGHGETVFALAIANGVGGGGGGFDEGGDPTALVASSADTYNHASLNNSTAASSATNPTKQKDGPEASNSTIRSKKYIWILAVVLGLCIVVGGTVCATGNCSRVEKNRTNESSGDESIFEQRPYFETSVELRQAVDEYVRAKGSDSSGVAVQYGHPMGTWDVSRLFNFSGIFDGTNRYELKSSFDEDLSGWNVSQATDMFKMFAHLDVYSGKGLGTWDVSKVTNMRSMFHEAFMFQGDLSKWDVTSVKSFARLFSDCHLFNSNLADWNTRNALDMGWMFFDSRIFDQDISQWDVRKVEDFSEMFQKARLFNVNISGWSIQSATDLQRMFESAYEFNQDLSAWDVRQVTNMYQLFSGASVFNQSLCAWGDKLRFDTNVSHMFNFTGCANKSDPLLTADFSDLAGPFCHICKV